MNDIEQAFKALLSSPFADNPQIPQAIATLAEASRTELDIRSRLAGSDPLLCLIDAIEHTHAQRDFKTATAALKCIGNACIDNDNGRYAISSIGFDWAKQCLDYFCLLTESDGPREPLGDMDELTNLAWLTAKVLYNICSDYPPAQVKCFEAQLYVPLIVICTSPSASFELDEWSIVYDLLLWISVQRTEQQPPPITRPLSEFILIKLLSLPSCDKTPDLDDFATVVEVILTFIRDADCQAEIVRKKLVSGVWTCLLEVVVNLRRADTPECEKLLKALTASLSWCLSDIAAHPAFVEQYSPTNGWVNQGYTPNTPLPWIFELLDTITTSGGEQECKFPEQDSPYLLATACQILGNLLCALPVEDVTSLVETRALHVPLWNVCRNQKYISSEEVLHSVAGLLVQLTRPSAHIRELIGADVKAEASLTMLCEHKTPQIKQGGIRLLRALGKECPHNQERFAELAEGALASVQETASSTGTGSVEEVAERMGNAALT